MKRLIDKIKLFLSEVKQELAKCSRPSKDELIGSTSVIVVAMLILGAFTFVVDLGFHVMLKWMVR